MDWKWVRRLLPSPIPRAEEEQVPVWSIRRSDTATFFRMVSALWLVALLRIGYKATERADAPFADWGSAADWGLIVLRDLGEVGFGAVVLAMLLTRPVNMMGGIAMTLYQAMANRWVIPVIERHKSEGRAEGLAEGLERGMEQGMQQGMQRGMEQGVRRGRVDGERAVLERQLRRRFGALSPEVEERMGEASAADIATWLDRVLDADTLEDVFNSIHRG